MNLVSIRILNAVIQALLVVMLLILLAFRNMKRFIIPLIIVLISIFWPIVPLSLQYSNCFYIMVIGSIAALVAPTNPRTNTTHYVLFTVIGAATSFFDLLTYPLVTLGAPLMIAVFRNASGLSNMIGSKVFLSVLRLSLCWALGYGGMWIAKWVIATIVLGRNVIADGLSNAAVRSGQADGSYTTLNVLQNNFSSLQDTGVLVPFCILLIASIIFVLTFDKKNGGGFLTCASPLSPLG